jgi:hypothetical protein
MGLFFSDNSNSLKETTITIKTAIAYLNQATNDKIQEIKDNEDYNTSRVDEKNIDYKNILVIYAVVSTNRNKDKNILVMTMKDYEELEEVFFKVVNFDYKIEKYKVKVHHEDGTTSTKTKRRLLIYVNSLSIEEMMNVYKMNTKEKQQVYDMFNDEYTDMWDEIM